MTYTLGQRSKTRLEGVHPDLVKVVQLAITLSSQDFTVLEGLRSKARQAELVATGASKTYRSRHLTGHAVDLGAWVNGTVSWDWSLYGSINRAMQDASTELGIPVEWGGNWTTFKDGPHFQLPWKDYP